MTVNIPRHIIKQGSPIFVHDDESLQRHQAQFSLNGISAHPNSVFQIDQSTMRPKNEKRSHWSIAWSDLMMTMFILFLSLFVYQAAHKDFLITNEKEIIAGKSEELPELVEQDSNATFPFLPIQPATPMVTMKTVQTAETITLSEIDMEATFAGVDMGKTLDELSKIVQKERRPKPKPRNLTPLDSPAPQQASGKIDIPKIAGQISLPQQTIQPPIEKIEVFQPTEPAETILEPKPMVVDNSAEESVNSLFDESQVTLDTFKLNEFATIDLVPDKAVRIILTGDLLFETGAAALSKEAVYSLEKIAEVISSSQHQIHIEGHTDNVPIHSGRYTNNWELSFARANAVAVFLIKDMGMDPEQFVISGYSSYRPVAPNTTPRNRAANRRVEIVIQQQPYQLKDSTLAQSF